MACKGPVTPFFTSQGDRSSFRRNYSVGVSTKSAAGHTPVHLQICPLVYGRLFIRKAEECLNTFKGYLQHVQTHLYND